MRILLLCLVAALVSCGQPEPNTYPPQYELNFMRACQAQGPVGDVCSCTWEKIQREIPPAEFAAFERLPASEQVGHPLYGQIERFAIGCRNEAVDALEDPPAP
jgi:hypothetical protein